MLISFRMNFKLNNCPLVSSRYNAWAIQLQSDIFLAYFTFAGYHKENMHHCFILRNTILYYTTTELPHSCQEKSQDKPPWQVTAREISGPVAHILCGFACLPVDAVCTADRDVKKVSGAV